MAHLSLSCLGSFQVTLEGQPVTDFKSNKVRALLAYLAVEADRPHRREVLAGLLWPDWPDRDALSNLRYTLSDLRRVIGDRTAEPPFLLVSRDTLQFNATSDHWLDVAAFSDSTTQKDLPGLEEAIILYQGSFLEGFSLGDSAPFEEWTLFVRERLARRMSSALHHLAAACEQGGEYKRAQSFARRQIELEPWDEMAHQQLMRALVLDGRRSAALAQYETCRRLLAEELGVEPSAETNHLYDQIRDGKLKSLVPSPPSPPDLTATLPPFLQEEPVQAERPIFVARERELSQLDRFLDLALTGQGRVVFVTGEAGSGKTALVQEFTQRIQEAHANLVVASGNCNAYTGIGDPYLPFREILELLAGDVEARWAAGAATREHARRLWNTLPLTAQALVSAGPDLIDTFVPHAALLARAMTCTQWPGRADWLIRLNKLVAGRPLGPARPSPQQSDLFEQYTRVLQTLARQLSLVLILDDLQWADLGSISLLFHLGRHLAGSHILIVGAYRPEEVAIGREGERHPLEPVVNEFQRVFGNIIVNLGQAESRSFIEAYLDSEPNWLGVAFREMLYRQTRGHPLFTIELLRGLQERGDLVRDPEGRWVEGPALDWETLPARVEAVIAERIGRLPQRVRDLLSVASVEGEAFTAEVAARVQARGERETVRCLSETLDRRHRLVSFHGIQRLGEQRLSRYRFRHILFQRYLYSTLDQAERAYLHEQVGSVLEGLYHGQESAAVAVQLARHFQEAGIADKAIPYLHQAFVRAVQVSAYEEGLAHVTQGLALVMTRPDSPDRDRQQLDFQMALGVALQGARGTYASEMKDAYLKARELCMKTGETSRLCRVLSELAIHHYVRGEHQKAREFGEQALSVAQRVNDSLLEAVSRWCLGLALFCLGDFKTAHAHFERVIAFYVPQQHHHSLVSLRGSDAGLSALAYAACTLWCLGYPDQALQRSQTALALARELNHPFSLADVLSYGGCLFNAMRRDAQALKDHAEELVRLSSDKIPVWSATGECFLGRALVLLGQVQEGLAQLREGIAVVQSIGSRIDLSRALVSWVEAQVRAGQPEAGLATLAEALALVEQTDERYLEAELARLRAELLLMQGKEAEAEASLQHAIEVARRQSAKSWELRATTSLARLWQTQGKMSEARHVLAEVYGWFTEGFDTADMKEAKALLEE
jgi:DNA-binding SARP family transcriptional activator/predicted ATPase